MSPSTHHFRLRFIFCCYSVLIILITHFLLPPLQAGEAGTAPCTFSHSEAVLATIERACTPVSNSSLRSPLINRCRASKALPSNKAETATTLKCVSEPLGTL